ncbi:hypothetical protein K1719_037741 [Acacia pycnantha]|nr:hypothetical protein K1719_037741 [Acacia pycnantha]
MHISSTTNHRGTHVDAIVYMLAYDPFLVAALRHNRSLMLRHWHNLIHIPACYPFLAVAESWMNRTGIWKTGTARTRWPGIFEPLLIQKHPSKLGQGRSQVTTPLISLFQSHVLLYPRSIISQTHERRRIIPPCQCLFKIESFSTLSKASVENYTSEEFEAGGYQWTLSMYPTGNKKKDGQDHISAYLNLTVSSSSSFPVGWEVNAIVNLFVYDFLRDECFSYQDASTRHFHNLQIEWGISKFVDLVLFHDHSNGFQIEDACIFGAEIFVIKPPSKQEYLSMITSSSVL